jgi:hypothetical protein
MTSLDTGTSTMCLTIDGFGLQTGLTDHLYIVTASNYNTIANLYTLQMIEHTLVFSVRYSPH